MGYVATPRTITRTAITLAALVWPLGTPLLAHADPPPSPATAFQLPATFVSACSTVGFQCWVPYQVASVTPSWTPTEAGAVAFSAEPSATVATTTLDCIDVSIAWRNLTTGTTGVTVLQAVTPPYHGPRPAPDRLCRYLPATAATGSGTVVATADVSGSAHPPRSDLWPQLPLHPGVGVLTVS